MPDVIRTIQTVSFRATILIIDVASEAVYAAARCYGTQLVRRAVHSIYYANHPLMGAIKCMLAAISTGNSINCQIFYHKS